MNAFQVTISARLRKNPVAVTLAELGIDIRYITLRRGDFVLGGRYGIKYYLGNDFIKAILDRSFYREIVELKREYTDPVIIVEGENPFHHPDINLATVHGAMLFASLPNRVPILTTRNDAETSQLLFMMAAQTDGSIDWQMASAAKGAQVLPSGNNGNGDPRISIIANLPDVGPSLAKGLLKHFGSLSRLFTAKVKDLQKVEGIGPKRAEKIFAFLNGNRAA